MAEICVVYLSEDEDSVAKIVEHLGKRWDVWWARNIDYGNWENIVRFQIQNAAAVVAVLSHHAVGDRREVITDEMHFAKSRTVPLFPFLISQTELPFGFGSQNRTDAYNFAGNQGREGLQLLERKLAKTIGPGRQSFATDGRPDSINIRDKTLNIPAFVFSLSSHETQVTPKEGASLLHLLAPEAMLVSAYDAWKYLQRDKQFRSTLSAIRDSHEVLYFDSGNYESYRKADRYMPKRNPSGWSRSAFHRTVMRYSPDLAFSFDTIDPRGTPNEIVGRVVKDFLQDDLALARRSFPLCPIVHLPRTTDITLSECASQIVAGVAAELDPLMIAIPERELGDGLLQRARTVRDIRRALNSLGKYYPLHLLGTGNPLSMIALAAAGADSFDGLEWCRTVADYEHGFLFHFQHFDCFSESQRGRIEDATVRHIVGDPAASYAARALSYNVDYFRNAARTMQSMIHAGQIKTLLNEIPNIGSQLFKDLSA